MPKWQYVAELPVAPPHFPPPETCIALRSDAATKSGARVIERFETPTDEFGIPNPHETLRLLASTLDASYQLPSATNVHHQVHFRREYTDSIEREFRESPSLMMNISVQMHNLDHALLIRAPKPALRVMEQYVLEQRLVSALFGLGSAAIRNQRIADTLSSRLEQATYTEMRQLIEMITSATRRARMKRHLYEKTLHRQKSPGPLGLLPDPEHLDSIGLAAAATYLGKIGGNEFLDFRRASQDFIVRYGIQQGAANQADKPEYGREVAA